MTNSNVRKIAHQLLLRVEKSRSFSHLLITEALKKEKLKLVDEKLLTELVYGTLERQITLDYFISSFIHSKKKLDDGVNVLLRMSVYQLYYLTRIPPYAAVNEAVTIAKEKGHKGVSSFVNGILRSMIRDGFPNIEEIKDPIKYLSIKTSHPEWLVERWAQHYGYDKTKAMCETNVTVKPINIRVNTLKTTVKEVTKMLNEEKIEWKSPYQLLKHGIIITEGNVLKTKLVEDGYVTIQDLSSMLVAQLLDVKPAMKVLDTCSAPGGKATYIGEQMDNEGSIFAHDLHKNKLKLINNNAKRLGITNLNVSQQDARKLQEVYAEHTFDRILVDAPCSGLGVIRSKPEIKYEKSLTDFKNLQQIQLDILFHVTPLLKKTGKLIYSTCTVEKLENEEVVKLFLQKQSTLRVDEHFLKEVKDWSLPGVTITEYGMQIFPQSMNSDGFFITRFINF